MKPHLIFKISQISPANIKRELFEAARGLLQKFEEDRRVGGGVQNVEPRSDGAETAH